MEAPGAEAEAVGVGVGVHNPACLLQTCRPHSHAGNAVSIHLNKLSRAHFLGVASALLRTSPEGLFMSGGRLHILQRPFQLYFNYSFAMLNLGWAPPTLTVVTAAPNRMPVSCHRLAAAPAGRFQGSLRRSGSCLDKLWEASQQQSASSLNPGLK